MTLDVPGATLQVCVRQRSGPDALIYFGGNAEDVSFSLNEFAAAFPQHSIYMLYYRGYGGSTGSPSEAALHADAQALFDQVQKEHPNIVLVGRSLGSGVAVRLAANNPVRNSCWSRPTTAFSTWRSSGFGSCQSVCCCKIATSRARCAASESAHSNHCGRARRSHSTRQHIGPA